VNFHTSSTHVSHTSSDTLLGFRYFDSITSNLDNPIERKAFDLISLFPNVHVYNVHDLGLDDKTGFGDMKSYPHCTNFAHLILDAEWIVHFDIDEVFSFKPLLLDAEPNCDQSEYGIPVGALQDFTTRLSRDVLAVIFPRFGLNANGVISPPKSKGQMELYLERWKSPEHGGKVMLRTGSIQKTFSPDKHSVWSPIKGSVIYPSGLNASVHVCQEDKCLYHMDYQENYIHAPSIYHYTTRSVEECKNKLKGNAEMINKTGFESWRTGNDQICAEHYDKSNAVRDYALFCAGKAVSLELRDRYQTYDQSPFVF
jgi:hypothetical protein